MRKKFLILICFCCLVLSGFGQVIEKSTASVMFVISEVVIYKDTAVAILHNAEGYNIKMNSKITAYSQYQQGDSIKKTVNFEIIGEGRVMKADTLVAVLIKLYPDVKEIMKGDIVSIDLPLSNPSQRTILSDISNSQIIFTDNLKDPFYKPQKIYLQENGVNRDSIYKAMLDALVEVHDMIDGTAQGNELSAKLTEGTYKGKSVMEMLTSSKREDLESFFYFVNSFPAKYIGHDYKISETYATWLINAAPKGHMEILVKLYPGYKTNKNFKTQLAYYKDEILKENHIRSISDEVIRYVQKEKYKEASELNAFVKVLAYSFGDMVGKASYWRSEAEMLQNKDKFKGAIVLCDSSIYYAKLSGDKDEILNGMAKKLYNLMQDKNYSAAIPYAAVFHETLLAAKKDIPASSFYFNETKYFQYLAQAYYNDGDNKNALDLYEKLIENNLKQNTYSSLLQNAEYYKFIGKVNNNQGLSKEAIPYFEKASNIYRRNADTLNWADVTSDLAYTYNKLNDYDESNRFSDSAIKIATTVNDNNTVGYAWSMKGSNLWGKGNYAEAVAAHKTAIDFRKKSKNVSGQAFSWSSIGDLYLLSGDKTLALDAFDKSSTLYGDANEKNEQADIINKQGEVYANDENYKKAAIYYEKAKGISTKSTEYALYNLGNAYRSLDTVKANKYFIDCINSCKVTNNIGLQFDAVYSLTAMNYSTGKYNTGAYWFTEASRLASLLNTDYYRAAMLTLKASTYQSQSIIDRSMALYKMSIPLYDTISKTSQVWAYNSLGELNISRGNFNEAAAAYTSAVTIAREINNSIALGSSLQAFTFVDALTGNFEEGLKKSDTALSIFRKSGNFYREGNTYLTRGILMESIGEYKNAISSFLRADSIYKDLGIDDMESTIFTNMGVVYYKQADFKNTLKYHQLALDKLDKNVVDETYILTVGNVAEANMYLKKYDEAEKMLLQYIPIAKEKDLGRILSGMDGTLGQLYFETAKFAKAKTYLQDELNYGLESGEKEKTIHAYNYLAQINIAEKDIPSAEKNLAAAVAFATQYNINSSWDAFYQLGLLRFNQKQFDSSIVYFKKAISMLESSAEKLYGGEEARKIYNNDPRKSDLYTKITFAYYNLGDVGAAWNYANRSNIAGIKELSGSLTATSGDKEKNEALKKILLLQQEKKQLEQTLEKQVGDDRKITLKKIEIQEANYQNFVQDMTAKYDDLAIYFSKTNADEFNTYKGKLPKDLAVLLFLQNNNSLMIFSLTNEKLSVDTMTISLEGQIKDFIATIKNTGKGTGTGSLSLRSDPVDEDEPAPAKDFKTQSYELYKILIATVQEKIKGKEKLCIIPSGIFSNLPFQCLGQPTKGDGFRFLIEEHSVFYTNKMSIFNDQAPRETKVDMSSFAAFGVPDPSLTFNITEVNEIGKIIKNESAIYADSRATESLAKESLRTKKIIHFATHGVLNYTTDYSQSYLKLLPDKDSSTGNNGKLTMREIQGLGITNCNMVILSACQTAVSTQLVKGWNISPANSFLISNVKTVVASLWKVADEPTGLLMEYFYENLTQTASMNKLDALRAAQIKLSQNPKFSHPNYWGAFVLYGDYR